MLRNDRTKGQGLRYQLHKQAILEELRNSSYPDWVGHYEASAMWEHQEFLISPSGLFVKNHTSDVRQPVGLYGTAELVGGQFILRLAPGVDDHHNSAVIPGPYFVAWGDKRYVVEPADMLVFVNAINAIGSPSAMCGVAGFKCVAMNRKQAAARLEPTLPVLPPPWNLYLLPQPVEAKVTRTGPYTTTTYPKYQLVKTDIEIDRGASSGLRPGMQLYFERKRGHGKATLTVESVDQESATLEFSDFGDSDIHQYGPPAVGARVSSRHPQSELAQ